MCCDILRTSNCTPKKVYNRSMKVNSEHIKTLRLENNLTQGDLGDIIGKSQQSISRLEKESRDIEVDELCILADHFNVSTDFLLGRTEVRNSPDSKDMYERLLFENYSVLKGLNNLDLEDKSHLSTIIANIMLLLDRYIKKS